MPEKTPTSSWIERTTGVFKEFSGQFWLLVSASFIDRLGGAMLFPFFTLFLTRKFGIGMTEVGLLFVLFSVSSMIGNVVGGALTDRLGRKGMMIFGLIMSAFSALLMGYIDNLTIFFIVIPLVGILTDAAGPAQQALVADLLPEQKRAQGYGILRVVYNLAVVIGPLIGGLLAVRSYLLIFITDAILSTITALIVALVIKETHKPKEVAEGGTGETFFETFKGYGQVLKDTALVTFMIASILMVLVYIQMNTTLAVYLRDQHGVNEQGFSYILALNAGMVVLMQFPITRFVTRYRPLVIMAAGTLMYAVGFAMYGFVGAFWLFLAAMAIITVGEMFVSPVGQAIVAQLAPEEMRGRYMAVYGFAWMIPFMVGPLLAGLVLDNLNPNMLWYISGILGLIAAAAFYSLSSLGDRARWRAIDQRLEILQQLEDGKITAEAAASALEKVGEGHWQRLAPQVAAAERRHVHLKVSDRQTGDVKAELLIPAGLAYTVVNTGGQFSPALAIYPHEHLRDLLSKNEQMNEPQAFDSGDDHIEVKMD
jgi:MFS family permease